MRILWTLLLISGTVSAQTIPRRLTLEQAEEVALKRQPLIRASQYTAEAARAIITQNRSSYFPTLSANITGAGGLSGSRLAAGAINNPLVLDRFAGGLNVSQLLTDFGRTARLVDSAKLGYKARQEDTKRAQADVLLRVDRAFFNVLRTQQLVRVANETVSARKTVADQVSALARSKLKSGLDESFANTNLAEANLLLTNAQNDVAAASAELAATMDLPPGTTFELKAPEQVSPLPDVAGLIEQAKTNRPEIRSARLDFETAQQFAKAEGNLKRPTLSAIASAGYTPFRDETELRERWAAAGVNLSIPIFNGHLFSARQSEAESRALAIEQNLRELENEVSRDVQTSWLNARTATERVSLTNQLLNQASQGLDLAQARYDLGLSSIVELTQAQLAKTSAEIAQANAQFDAALARSVVDYEAGLKVK